MRCEVDTQSKWQINNAMKCGKFKDCGNNHKNINTKWF